MHQGAFSADVRPSRLLVTPVGGHSYGAQIIPRDGAIVDNRESSPRGTGDNEEAGAGCDGSIPWGAG
jgi:hypothetical protein